MGKITKEMCEKAYPVAKQVWEGTLNRNEGKYKINKLSGMTEGSAYIFIAIFLSMMKGEGYKRAFNNEGNNLLFDKILEDYGVAGTMLQQERCSFFLMCMARI